MCMHTPEGEGFKKGEKMQLYSVLSALHICLAGWGEAVLQDGTYQVNAH